MLVITLSKLAAAGGALAAVCLLGERVLLRGFDYFTFVEKGVRVVHA